MRLRRRGGVTLIIFVAIPLSLVDLCIHLEEHSRKRTQGPPSHHPWYSSRVGIGEEPCFSLCIVPQKFQVNQTEQWGCMQACFDVRIVIQSQIHQVLLSLHRME